MQILAISRQKEGITPDKFAPFLEEEVKHTLEAYLQGSIRNFWFKADRPGVVFMLESADTKAAQSMLAELPLVEAELIEFDLIPLQPLKPLGTLIGMEMQL
ncbi:hypothetical protein [Psychromonas aquimarina]|uniref:hypothetical protein n=1 Tax=Psychromonas aquimarina TaxID=444919 RepID=UPI000421BAE1|nr:hypothetical protein [Psychromonas aquimarina]